MRKKLVILLFLICPAILAQTPNIEWRKAFGTIRGNNEGWMVQETFDGGLIIVGQSGGYNGYDRNIYLIKTDSLGDTLWTRSFETSLDEYGRAVRQTADGGYSIAGFISNSYSSNDVYLRKIDSLGNTQWRRIYQYSLHDEEARSLELTPDGGYILAGSTWRSDNHDVFIVRADSIGDTIWTRRYGGNYNDKAWSIKNTHDGGFIIAGWSNLLPVPQENSQIYVIRINSDGDTIWTRRYGTPYNDEGRSVLELPDYRYILVGKYGAPGSAAHSMMLCLTENGDSLWSSVYDSNYEATSVAPTFDGGYILCGFNYDNSIYSEFVRKTDAFGNSIWDISGEDSTYAHYIIQTSDSGYVFVGYASESLSLTKISPERPTGIRDKNELIPRKLKLNQNYPNPFNHDTKIEYALYDYSHVSLIIYDLLGNKVVSLISSDQKPGIYQVNWNANDIPSGMYFYRLKAGDFSDTRRMMLLK